MTLPFIRSRLAGRSRAGHAVAFDPAGQVGGPQAHVGGTQVGTGQEAVAQRRAAVATILRDSPCGPEVLLIRRAEHPQDPWSGHMAFPGGREEPHDADLFATAVRETQEEVALDLRKSAELIGRLDDLPAIARGKRTGLVIAPFVFVLTEPAELRPNYEVSAVVWAPVEPMLRGEQRSTIPYEFEGRRLDLPAYDVAGHKVWGLTYRMLEGLFALLK